MVQEADTQDIEKEQTTEQLEVVSNFDIYRGQKTEAIDSTTEEVGSKIEEQKVAEFKIVGKMSKEIAQEFVDKADDLIISRLEVKNTQVSGSVSGDLEIRFNKLDYILDEPAFIQIVEDVLTSKHASGNLLRNGRPLTQSEFDQVLESVLKDASVFYRAEILPIIARHEESQKSKDKETKGIQVQHGKQGVVPKDKQKARKKEASGPNAQDRIVSGLISKTAVEAMHNQEARKRRRVEEARIEELDENARVVHSEVAKQELRRTSNKQDERSTDIKLDANKSRDVENKGANAQISKAKSGKRKKIT